MRTLKFCIAVTVCLMLIVVAGPAQDKSANKYVGVSTCAPCHKAEKTGNQFGVWQKSKHADSYKALTTPKADEIAKAKGLKKPAAESPECLQCHVTTTDAAVMEKTFDMKMGNQCETCHGPGSAYKSMSIMKDKAKSAAAGLIVYKDDAAIEAKCKTCHNDKSPTFKSFVFKDMWPKIKHAVPKG
jgi:hypothetical protein